MFQIGNKKGEQIGSAAGVVLERENVEVKCWARILEGRKVLSKRSLPGKEGDEM